VNEGSAKFELVSSVGNSCFGNDNLDCRKVLIDASKQLVFVSYNR
jgi:hypothetical protein